MSSIYQSKKDFTVRTLNKNIIYLLTISLIGLSSTSLFAQGQPSNTKKYYDIANGVWTWHKSEPKPLVLRPTDEPQTAPVVKANSTQATETIPTASVPAVTPATTTLTSTQNANAPFTNGVMQNQFTENTNLVDGGNSAQPTFAPDPALTSQLPSYKADKSPSNNYIKNLKNNVSNSFKEQKGRPADSRLPKKPSQVAYQPTKVQFLLDKTDAQLEPVATLDIGLESKVNKNQFLTEEMQDLSIEYKTPDTLPSPKKISRTEISSIVNYKLKVGKTRKLKGKRWKLGRMVEASEVETIKYTITENKSFELLKVDPVSKYDVFMLSAIILYQKEMYSPALGLFDQLTESKKHVQEASYYMGTISHKLKLYSETAHRLIPLVLKPNEYRADAIGILFTDFPKEHESKIALSLSKMEDKETLPPLFMDKIAYYISKHQFDNKDYKSSQLTATQVSKKSDYYEKAQFIKGLSEYLNKDLTTSVTTLGTLQGHLEKNSKEEKNIGSLVSLNLGRIFFQLKKYKEAYHSYKRIHKSHPLWVQAMTELGWVQLALGDQFGAIGNMYSMHSPYFNSIYKPETYVIKTIGYLNICQYADAYKSLSLHEKEYRDWKTKLNTYLASNNSGFSIYQTVSKYLAGKSTVDVDGLPYQVIREIARQKDFLNIQKDINSKVDESRNYTKALSSFKLDTKKLKGKLSKAKASLKKIKSEYDIAKKVKNETTLPSLKSNLEEKKEYITSYYFQLRLFDHSKKKLNILKRNTQARIKKENGVLISRAGKSLYKHLSNVKNENSDLLDNNELLRYEIFSGSGENIRFQVSGGKVSNENRIPASVKPKKALNWDFSGEYWEDEIGSYRTTLVDKCPK